MVITISCIKWASTFSSCVAEVSSDTLPPPPSSLITVASSKRRFSPSSALRTSVPLRIILSSMFPIPTPVACNLRLISGSISISNNEPSIGENLVVSLV